MHSPGNSHCFFHGKWQGFSLRACNTIGAKENIVQCVMILCCELTSFAVSLREGVSGLQRSLQAPDEVMYRVSLREGVSGLQHPLLVVVRDQSLSRSVRE